MNTPTPRTDKAEFSFDTYNGVDPWEGERWIKVVPSKISAKLETELTAVTEQRDRLLEQQGQWRLSSVCREYRKQLDRLAEALRKIADCDWIITLPDRMDAVREIANEALQSLNQPTEP